MNRAVIDGKVLEYESAGSGDPVLFIHGALIADAFRPLFAEPALASKYRLIAYRRRGYGGSSKPGVSMTVEDQARDALDLLHWLDVDYAHVVGHSFGGVVAIQLALSGSSAVRSLALLEPALIVGDSAEAYRQSLSGAVEQFEFTDPRGVVGMMLEMRWPDYREDLEKVLPGAFEAAVSDAATVFESELPALLGWRFGADESGQLKQPVLSVIGERSVLLSPRFEEAHRLLLEHLPVVEGYVLPRSHHFLQLENPRDMAEALASFIGRHR